MATIKIYDAQNDESNIELKNAGADEVDQMTMIIDHPDVPDDYIYFNLSKDEAKEMIAYFRKEFKI